MFEYIEDEALREKAIADYQLSIDNLKVDMSKSTKEEIDKAVAGLKANHDKLLDEKKKLQERFKDIKDPDEALAALNMLNDNPDLKLIKEGKLEEVIAKRVSESTTEYEERIKSLSEKLETTEMSSTKYQSLYTDTIRDLRLKEAAAAAGVLPSAMIDVLARGREVFSIAEDEKSIEARDAKGKLRVNAEDKIMTPEVWIEGLRKTSPHFWPQSKSGNLVPGSTGSDIEQQIAEAAKSKNTKLYRALRKKQAEMAQE